MERGWWDVVMLVVSTVSFFSFVLQLLALLHYSNGWYVKVGASTNDGLVLYRSRAVARLRYGHRR